MAVNYGVCAKEIYEALGGRSNLVSVAHCATRLRVATVDDSRVDRNRLEGIDGVKGVFSSGGQLQVIVGTGAVVKLYDEFLKVSGMGAATKEDVKNAAAARQPLPKRMVKALGDVFVPVLPAIVASGLAMGLVEALGKAIPSFAGSDWYGILDLIANTAFIFLPVLIAMSAARVFGGDIFLGAVIGMVMIHPNLLDAWSVGPMDAAEIPVWHLFGFLPIRQVGYQGHVIPVIAGVWIMCKIERQLHRRVPEAVDLFVTPLCTVLATAFITLGVIGPVFSAAESRVLEFAGWVVTVGHGTGAMVMGAFYPVTVVCGIHHMYNVIEAGMLAAEGRNLWMPIASAANFAQGAACLAVGLKAKNPKTKAVAVPSSLSAALGITEPAIFGVNLRFGKPFICGMAGGAAGALLGSLFHVGATSYGVTGIPGFLITLDHALQYGIVLAVSFGISFALTWFVWREGAGDAGKGAGTETVLYAPVKGMVIPREEIPDETFAAGILGDGVGIEPEKGEVWAPFDGEVTFAADTCHAIGITASDGTEALIHVGIGTVNMKGDGFRLFVAKGDRVKAGQKLLAFDIRKVREAGYSAVTAVLLTNGGYSDVEIAKSGKTGRMERLMTVRRKGKSGNDEQKIP